MTDEPTQPPIEELIQSHFVRVGRQGKTLDKRRDWSLFMFFRVMNQAEWDSSAARILGKPDEPPSMNYQQLIFEMINPTLWKALDVDPEVGTPSVTPSPPVDLFLNWLKGITGQESRTLINGLGALHERTLAAAQNPAPAPAEFNLSSFFEGTALESADGIADVKTFTGMLGRIQALADDHTPTHGLEMLKKGLAGVCEYEVIRQVARATQRVPVVRSYAAEASLHQVDGDRSPVEVAFTYSGLKAAGVHERVLKSFPDAFREGMAARASRLGDTGASAPTHWDGELGQSVVHGMLVGGFSVEGAFHSHWEELRRQIDVFNTGGPGEGLRLRFQIGLLFRAIGIELLHIELGQDPYNVGPGGAILPLKHRHEHFGFRDGISQPTFESAGSGTPGDNGSWIPLARGEIFLGDKDEDKCTQEVPSNDPLRIGGTYLVVRKLKQDVAGFRSFLKAARPESKEQQDRLAAQFVGRWQNGMSLVRAPGSPPHIPDSQEKDLNNFRYAEEDPTGRYCPMGAHVRRVNPRDIGGKAQSRRHRLLRRGMAYGGALLPEGAQDDGKERGMLFVAANARIDVQFELIQSRWINGGEFLGQAGLNKCPITGANAGLPEDKFVTPDTVVPLAGMPRFVHTRGGDYFYAPGPEGLKAIANSAVGDPTNPVPNEFGHNSAKTPDVFSPDYIRDLVKKTLGIGPQKVEFPPAIGPGGIAINDLAGAPMVFVGKHAHVRKVISGQLSSVGVPHYIEASERMFSGERILISTDVRDPILRKNMKKILESAWKELNPYKAFDQELDNAISAAIAKTKQVGRIDLVHDLAVEPIYQLIANVYGVPGPNWLTELAVSLKFGARHLSELHPDWLDLLKGKAPSNPRLATLQIWSILLFADLIGNIKHQAELKALGMEAASQFTLYLTQLLMREQAKPKKKPGQSKTLVEAFCTVESQFVGPNMTQREYYRIARLLLTELVPSALAVIPTTFASVISNLLENHINLPLLVPLLATKPDGVKRLIYEMNRLKPSLPVLQRYALDDVVLSEKNEPLVKIDKGNWIGAMVIAANFDESVFPNAQTFSLGTAFGGEKRDLDDYLLFGSVGSDRQCFGRDHLAMFALEKFMRSAARLHGLRRVAGDSGKEAKVVGITIGLPARFAPF